jgi:hypothetical protein
MLHVRGHYQIRCRVQAHTSETLRWRFGRESTSVAPTCADGRSVVVQALRGVLANQTAPPRRRMCWTSQVRHVVE